MRVRTYQACSSGLVEESSMYGNPTVPPNSRMICQVGSPAADGFQRAAGIIGSVADARGQQHAACTQTCRWRLHIPDQAMRIKISGQQDQLEEQQRRAPHRRRSSEPRQNEFRDQRLHLEQQERAEENSRGVDQHGIA